MMEVPQCIEEDLLGHSIVGVEKLTGSEYYEMGGNYGCDMAVILTLDNGQKYRMAGYGDCCAGADVDVTKFHENNNIITDVICEPNAHCDESSGDITMHLLSGSEPVIDIDIDWGEGSGYYAFGIDIRVIKEK